MSQDAIWPLKAALSKSFALRRQFVFASPEPVTWKTLRPLLPDHSDPIDVLHAGSGTVRIVA